MHTVPVQIIRWADAAFPGWVECVLRDAFGRDWSFVDKVPIFTEANLDAGSSYPQPGVLDCEVMREWTDGNGRRICTVNTEKPWGVAALTGETQFEVVAHHVSERVS
jgi:hypothetical protein